MSSRYAIALVVVVFLTCACIGYKERAYRQAALKDNELRCNQKNLTYSQDIDACVTEGIDVSEETLSMILEEASSIAGREKIKEMEIISQRCRGCYIVNVLTSKTLRTINIRNFKVERSAHNLGRKECEELESKRWCAPIATCINRQSKCPGEDYKYGTPVLDLLVDEAYGRLVEGVSPDRILSHEVSHVVKLRCEGCYELGFVIKLKDEHPLIKVAEVFFENESITQVKSRMLGGVFENESQCMAQTNGSEVVVHKTPLDHMVYCNPHQTYLGQVKSMNTAYCCVDNINIYGSRSYMERDYQYGMRCNAARYKCPTGYMLYSDQRGCGCVKIYALGFGNETYCEPADRGRLYCEDEEEKGKVCGWFSKGDVKCPHFPCSTTYDSKCIACIDDYVEYVTEGSCPMDPNFIKPDSFSDCLASGYPYIEEGSYGICAPPDGSLFY